MLQVLDTIAATRAAIAESRLRGSIGFVPTMGALHEGHASLIQCARRECDTVVASIFVNPLQFDRPDDLERYPRSLEADLELCRRDGIHLVFAPRVSEMYPRPMEMAVDVGRLADHLCGRYRPGHFKGVATVVLKLLEIVRPDVAYFGEKDAQQLAVVRRLVTDFNVPVRIAGVPTVREADGLALSSRNQRLSTDERQLAPCLYAALKRAAVSVEKGASNVSEITRDAATAIPADDRLRLEYLELVDPEDFQPVTRVTGPVVAAGALWVGNTRLIDNVRCTPRKSA
ncbi:MAG TPA: pantoate--beta-alanine ligase [Vicinamibacterales bacterium]|nr:pantoate--beta-alanine ligase [Vicinamibacterales bacterium]